MFANILKQQFQIIVFVMLSYAPDIENPSESEKN